MTIVYVTIKANPDNAERILQLTKNFLKVPADAPRRAESPKNSCLVFIDANKKLQRVSSLAADRYILGALGDFLVLWFDDPIDDPSGDATILRYKLTTYFEKRYFLQVLDALRIALTRHIIDETPEMGRRERIQFTTKIRYDLGQPPIELLPSIPEQQPLQ